MAVGSTTGIIVATNAFFIINRLLPLGLESRSRLELTVFAAVWVTAFAHGWARPKTAWAEQSWAIAFSSIAAVLLNWITTGDHLLATLSKGDRAVAGMDLLLLLLALCAGYAGMKLSRRVKTKRAPAKQALAGAE